MECKQICLILSVLLLLVVLFSPKSEPYQNMQKNGKDSKKYLSGKSEKKPSTNTRPAPPKRK